MMRRILFAVFFLAQALVIVALFACLSLVLVKVAHAQSPAVYTGQSCGASASGNTASCTIAGVPAGATIVLDANTSGNTTGTPSVTGAGCTWALLPGYPQRWGGANTSAVWQGSGCSAGSHTVAASISGSASATSVMAVVATNVGLVEPTSGGLFIDYSLTPTCASVTATQPGELAFAFIHGGAAAGFTLESTPVPMSAAATIAGDPGETSAFGALSGPTTASLLFHQPAGYQTWCDTVVLGGPAAAVPTISPAAGAYPAGQAVTISTVTADAAIHYTLDSSTPSASSPLYTGPITLNGSAIVSAVAIKPGLYSGYSAPVSFVISPGTLEGLMPGPLGSLNGWVPSPNDAWHQDVSSWPVDANSVLITAAVANGGKAENLNNASLNFDGIPYTVVDSRQIGFSPIRFRPDTDHNGQSEGDITYIPVPATLPIESGNADPQNDCSDDYHGDDHGIEVDKATGAIIELGYVHICPTSTPKVSVSIETIWDGTLANGEERAYGETSVDAAGLSVFEGLARWDEVQAGVINHAIRVTVKNTKSNVNNGWFTPPAVHAAGNLGGTDNIMGMRLRLKSSFDISGYSATNRIILTAMKKYGFIVADNGNNMEFQITADPHWDYADLGNIHTGLHSGDFEVLSIPSGGYYSSSNTSGKIYDANVFPPGSPPVISSFAASPTVLEPGQCTTLNWVTSGQSYNTISTLGLVHGNTAQWCPTTPGVNTAKLVSANHYLTTQIDSTNPGDYLRPSATVSVTVISARLPVIQGGKAQGGVIRP